MSKTVEVPIKGGVALVDAEYEYLVKDLAWHVSGGCARHDVRRNGRLSCTYMHRLIWEHANGPIAHELRNEVVEELFAE